MRLKKIFILILLTSFFVSCEKQQELKLWYKQPAEHWYLEALPIGNGKLGALVRGKTDVERIVINEESIWAGGPGEQENYRGGNREEAWKNVAPIRELLNENKKKEAEKLLKKELLSKLINERKPKRNWRISENKPPVRNPEDGKIQLPGYGCYQPCVDLLVDLPENGAISEYRRELDLQNASVNISYKSGEVTHRRKSFASYPDEVLVFQFENDAEEGLEYSCNLETFHVIDEVEFATNVYRLKAHLSNNGQEFEAIMKVEGDIRNIEFAEQKLKLKGAKTFALIITANSDYLNEFPYYKGKNFVARNNRTLRALSNKKADQIFASHLSDYKKLFNRVNLDLGGLEHTDLPTDERLEKYGAGSSDKNLEALYFQYGRYLLISSSRETSMPANLQGKWNVQMDPQWACDYHFNINLQMNYWPAEITNLSECHEALMTYIPTLVKPGEVSAHDYFNARGWIASTMNNPYGYTANGFGTWGYFPASAAWLCRHMWEHYQFTGDVEFLRNKAYPVMKSAALFWLDYLQEDENGRLVSSPSYSPEHGGISKGASMDQQIVWDLFTMIMTAGDKLQQDHNFVAKIANAREKLLKPQIGKYGQLQEWKEDRDDPNDKHRHVSHLYALYPGNQISINETPLLAQAARKSLEFRGDEGTGWSVAWKVNFWARLHDGEHAYKCLKTLLTPCENHNHQGFKFNGGIYDNLFCAHPPFQIDGNLGGCAGIAEMILQSSSKSLTLLPAIPKEWSDGKVTGLKARGGFEVDVAWENNQVKCAKIASSSTTAYTVFSPNKLSYGKSKSEKDPAKKCWVLKLDVKAGKTYELRGV